MSSQLKDKLENHFLHIYQRSARNRRIYKCMHPICHSYTDKEYLLGKMSECPQCHEGFILDREALRRKTPLCTKCKLLNRGEMPPDEVMKEAFDANKALEEMLGGMIPKPNDEV
jgi:hypothetical protein